MRKWEMYAGRRLKGSAQEPKAEWWYAGHEHYVRAYGYVPEPVTVTEDPEGQYYGWLDSEERHAKFHDDHERYPHMVWPNEVLFSVCFPYGYQAEQKAGRGEVVRLRIEAR